MKTEAPPMLSKKQPWLASVLAVIFCAPAAHGQDIHEAVRSGDAVEARRLLTADPKLIKSRDKSQRTPLHWAVLGGDREILALILEHSPEIEARDFGGFIPLIHAGLSKAHAILPLLEHGADIDARDRSGETALHWAAEGGRNEAVRLLLKNGATVEPKDLIGWTPLIRAAKEGRTEAVSLLLEHGAEASQPWALVWAAGRGHLEVMELLIDSGADVNAAIKEFERTPLHLAAIRGRVEAAKMLIEAGANVNPRDSKDLTPLAHAEDKEHSSVARLLRSHGATR